MTPEGLASALKHGGAGHRRVLDACKSRIRMSEQRMRPRFQQMNKNDERFQAYVPESDLDAIRRTNRDNKGMPEYRTVEIPYSYACLMTAHTYYTSVFLGRSPVFQVSGRHGEGEMNVQSIEAILDYQRQVGEMSVPLYIWLLDPGKYGYGVLGHYWDEQYTNVRQVVEEPVTFMGMPVIGAAPRKVERVTEVPGYRGNRVYNVRPHDFFPDPRVPVRYFQKGEFCGRYIEHSWFDVVAGERAGRFFNVDKLRSMRRDKDTSSGGIVARDMGSSNVVSGLPDISVADIEDRIPAGFIKGYELYVKLIPNEWGFGKEDRVETWVITLSSNGIIYGCEPLAEFLDQFPFDVIEHEPEGYALVSRSMLEISQPLTDIISWLVNTHFYNVRQTLNNQFIVDPSMVVMKDVENPNPGRVIRLKPSAYGKDVRTLLTQLQNSDVTGRHMSDIGPITEFVQRALGTPDSVMGMLPTKSHTTATATRTSTSFGTNRLKTNCEYYSAMGWTPFVQKLIQRTQQRMDYEQYFRVAGDTAQYGKPWVQATPDTIRGFYDFIPVDGTLPVDRFAQANLWQMMLGQIRNYPQIMQNYDIAKIFGWVATLAGIKNIAQFKITPDALLQQQAQAGNVVPIGTAQKNLPPNLNEPRQVPGMGATG